MTLIAAHITANHIDILADGLSCHDRLTIAHTRQVGANSVLTDVPGRTTLQKIFPHPHLPFAVAHSGTNQRNATPIRVFIDHFWERVVSAQSASESLVQRFETEFSNGTGGETYWLIGWLTPDTPLVHVVGIDREHLDRARCWGGSGCDALPKRWSTINSLRENAERFLGECQKHAPYRLPFFANCYGGHWHHLQLTAGASPTWLIAPVHTGVEVSSLLPEPGRLISCNSPVHDIAARGEGLKGVLKETFGVKRVRGALERIADETLREKVARLIAIFDEVELDREVATLDDTQHYALAADDAILRLIERTVLDQHHRQCQILCCNQATAAEQLLRRYARILRDLRTGKISKPSNDSKSQTASDGLRGLAHCLRWIKACCPSKVITPSPGAAVLDQQALELLQWGVTYDPIWNEHSAYSRNLVDAKVDVQDHLIEFLPRCDFGSHFFCTQVEAKKADDERLGKASPDAQLAKLSKAWCESLRLSSRGMHFGDATIRDSGAIEVACEWMEKTCLPELASTAQLMGCTLQELRRVLATLYVYSLFVTKLEDVSDDLQGGEIVLQSTVIRLRRDRMVSWLVELSRVPAASVEAILAVITFDPTHPHVTLAQQPFVNVDDGQLMFLPRLLLFIDLPRMYISTLNKHGQGRSIYEHTINDIEAAGAETVAREVRAAVADSLQIKVKRRFLLPDGQLITPDMVVASEVDRTILVIDLKYATPPFGPADVHRDIEEMRKWEVRMAEYVASFEGNPDILAQHFQWACSGGATVVGLILLRWPLAIPFKFPEKVHAVDWPSLKEHMRQACTSSICDLMTWVTTRPDLPALAPLAWKMKEVHVRDWKYRYSVLSAVSEDRLLAPGDVLGAEEAPVKTGGE